MAADQPEPLEHFIAALSIENPFPFLSNEVAALYEKSNPRADPLKRQLYLILKRVAKLVEPHVIEYAIQLTFGAEDCKHSGNVAHERSRLRALLDACLLLPYKARAHGLCGAVRIPRSREDEAPSWYDPEVLYYPLTRFERRRRTNELFLRLLQHAFLHWRFCHDFDELDIGLDEELRFAIEEKRVHMPRQDRETDDDETLSWGSGWSEDEPVSEREKLYSLFQPIPSSCANLRTRRKAQKMSVCKADKRLQKRMFDLYRSLQLSPQPFKAVLTLLLPFQFSILEDVIRMQLEKAIIITESEFLSLAMEIFLTRPLDGGEPSENPSCLLVRPSPVPFVADVFDLESESRSSSSEASVVEVGRSKRRGRPPRRRVVSTSPSGESSSTSAERSRDPRRLPPRRAGRRRRGPSISTSSIDSSPERSESASSPSPAKFHVSQSVSLSVLPARTRARGACAREALPGDVKADGSVSRPPSVASSEKRGSAVPRRGSEPSMEQLLRDYSSLPPEQQISVSAKLHAAGFEYAAIVYAVEQSTDTRDFYEAMRAAGVRVAEAFAIVDACKKQRLASSN